jgi:PAS domain S-box-containing protein
MDGEMSPEHPNGPAQVPTATLSGLPLALVLTDPDLEDNPIVYANEAFARLTGYPVASIVGRNCRFLQGPQTQPDRVARIREAVAAGEDLAIEITNHRADGTPFLNRVTITTVEEDGKLAYFLGTQSARDPDDAETRLEAVELQLAEVQHRVKNHLAMIVGMIRMQARNPEAAQDYLMLARRIEALQLLYQELSDTGVASTGQDLVPLGAYVSRVAAAVGHLDGGQGVRINVSADEIMVEATMAARVGLLVSELLTNAFRHAFVGRDGGLVETRLERLADGRVRVQISDDGVGLPDGHGWPGRGNLGSRIVNALLTGLEATHVVETSPAGTTVTVDLPAPAGPV